MEKVFHAQRSKNCKNRNNYRKYVRPGRRKRQQRKTSRKWMDQFLIGKTSSDKAFNLKANVVLIKILIGSLMEHDQLK